MLRQVVLDDQDVEMLGMSRPFVDGWQCCLRVAGVSGCSSQR
jgi:hypothetical protein